MADWNSPFAQRIAQIREPYTFDELRQKIDSGEYSAELLLQHAMILLLDTRADRDSWAQQASDRCQDALDLVAAERERCDGITSALLGLLTDCAAVIRTVDAEDSDEDEKLADLLTAIDRAQEPHRHKGPLL